MATMMKMSLFFLLGLLLVMENARSSDTIKATGYNSDDDLMPGFNCEQEGDSTCAALFRGYDDVSMVMKLLSAVTM